MNDTCCDAHELAYCRIAYCCSRCSLLAQRIDTYRAAYAERYGLTTDER